MTSPSLSLPVVLVPGFRDDIHVLGALASHLRRQEMPAYPFAPQPSDGSVAIESLAGQLAQMIDDALGPTQRFVYFGFSMGGLIGRYYLQRLGGDARMARLITLATPHRGTWTARLLAQWPALAQMCPDSDFLADLNADLSPLHRVDFAAFWTPFDLSVTPPHNSYLADLPERRLYSPFHATLLYDPWVVGAVGRALAAPV